MKITSSPTETIVEKLTRIIMSAFPLARNTGRANDLVSVQNYKAAKGKAVTFKWKKSTFRLTENLKVNEFDFTNQLAETPLSKEAQEIVENFCKA